MNLKCSLAKLGIENRLQVFALDTNIGQWAKTHGFHVIEDSAIQEASLDHLALFGSKRFNLLSKMKLKAVRDLLKKRKNVLFTDTDVFLVWKFS